MENKKGAEMSIAMVVALVFAVIIIATVVLAYSYGFNNLLDKIKNYGGSINVDNVKQACQQACITESIHEYCCVDRKVRQVAGGTQTLMRCYDSLIKPDDCTTITQVQCVALCLKTAATP